MGKWYFLLVFVVFMTGCENTTEQLFRRGDWLYDQKKYDEAIAQYNEVIERNGKIQLAYFQRAACYVQQKKYRDALGDLNKTMDLHTVGGFIMTWNKNGLLGDDDVTKFQVDYYEAMYQRAILKDHMDSVKSAFIDFQTCINNNYEVNLCRLWQGILWIRAGNKANACSCFQKIYRPERDTTNAYVAVDTSYRAQAKTYIDKYCQ